MERRQLLTLCGAGLAGLSGCTIDPRDDPTATAPAETDRVTHTENTTRTTVVEEGTATGADHNTDLSVGFDALQSAVLEIDVDFLKLVYGGQFLYLDLSVESEPAPTLDELRF